MSDDREKFRIKERLKNLINDSDCKYKFTNRKTTDYIHHKINNETNLTFYVDFKKSEKEIRFGLGINAKKTKPEQKKQMIAKMKDQFFYFKSRREEIEKSFGSKLIWEFKSDRLSYQGIKKTMYWERGLPTEIVQKIQQFIAAVEPFLDSCPQLDL